MVSLQFIGYLLPMVHLDNADATSDFRRRTIEPHNTSDVHLLVQRDTSGEVHELIHGVKIIRLPDHLLVSVLEIGSGSTYGEGDLSVLGGEWEGGGRWRVTMLRISGTSVIWILKT